MIKRFFQFFMVAIVALAVLAGCSKEPDTKATIGLVVSTLSNPYFTLLRDGAENEARALQYKLIVLNSQNDSARELSSIKNLISKGVKVILINPNNAKENAAAIEYANSHGVKIITLDRSANDGVVDAHIASDNVRGGKMAAEYIAKKLGGNGDVAELEGVPNSSATIDRSEGFADGMKGTGLKLVYKANANANRSLAINAMDEILREHPKVAAVFAQNDEIALGAIHVLRKQNKDDIIVVGFDGTPEALMAVASGKMSATIAQQPYLMGQLGVKAAVDVLNGKAVQKEVIVPLTLITKEFFLDKKE
jgi:ribose transport system substrate-binding protein